MMKKIVIAGLLTVAAIAFAARDAFVELNNSPKAQWFFGGLYIGTAAKDPSSDTLNKLTYVLGKTVTVDLGSITGGNACDTSTTTTVTGAAIGDVCIVTPSVSDANNDGLAFDCLVSAANTVRIRACAHATDNMASDTLRVTVIGQGR